MKRRSLWWRKKYPESFHAVSEPGGENRGESLASQGRPVNPTHILHPKVVNSKASSHCFPLAHNTDNAFAEGQFLVAYVL